MLYCCISYLLRYYISYLCLRRIPFGIGGTHPSGAGDRGQLFLRLAPIITEVVREYVDNFKCIGSPYEQSYILTIRYDCCCIFLEMMGESCNYI